MAQNAPSQSTYRIPEGATSKEWIILIFDMLTEINIIKKN